MLVGPRPQLDLLHLGGFLMPPALVLLLAQLVLVFPVIHDPADGRLRGRRHFHQIVAQLLRLPECIHGGQDA